MDVNKMVTPIVEYFIISKLGHFEIISLLVPEQNKKNELIGPIFKLKIFIQYIK